MLPFNNIACVTLGYKEVQISHMNSFCDNNVSEISLPLNTVTNFSKNVGFPCKELCCVLILHDKAVNGNPKWLWSSSFVIIVSKLKVMTWWSHASFIAPACCISSWFPFQLHLSVINLSLGVSYLGVSELHVL